MFHHILVPLDGSTLAECVLPHVVAVARACHAPITLLHVVECGPCNDAAPPIDPLAWQLRKTAAQAYLDELGQRLAETALPIYTTLLEGRPAPRIIEYVRTHNIDLIALSSHGEGGASGWNIGSMVHQLVQRANISALLVRAYRSSTWKLTDLHYRRILAPLDGSLRADYAVAPAAKLAAYDDAQLILAHVVAKPPLFARTPPRHELIEMADCLLAYNCSEAMHYLEQLQAHLSGNVTTRIVVGEDVVERLHQLIAEEAIDLTIVSAHGRSGKTHWPFGSVSTNLILYGASPLLVVQDLPVEQIEPTPAERFAQEHARH